MTKSEKAIYTLTRQINSGTWRIGDKLPVEDELCKLIGVGRNTLREAVAALEQQGVLRRMQGAGTFLCQEFAPLGIEPEKGKPNPDIHVFCTCYYSHLEADFYGREILHDMSSRLSEQGRRLLIEVLPDAEMIQSKLLSLADELSGGCIFMNGLIPGDRELRFLAGKNIPVALLGRPVGKEPVAYVGNDDAEEVRIAIRHLADHGYKRIGMINGTSDFADHHLVVDAYREVLEEYGIAFDARLLGEAEPFRFNDAKNAARALLERCPDLDALAVSGDRAVLGALESVRECGRRIPADLGFFMLGELPWIQELSPVRLAGVRHDLHGMADKLLSMLDGLRAKRITPETHALLPPLFIPGRSCGCVPPPEAKPQNRRGIQAGI